jgi:ankyrin repeat protein
VTAPAPPRSLWLRKIPVALRPARGWYGTTPGGGPNPSDPKRGASALHWAALGGNLGLCRWLLDQARPRGVTFDRLSCETTTRLTAHPKPFPNGQEGGGSADKEERAERIAAAATAVDAAGRTPAGWALAAGHVPVARWLVRRRSFSTSRRVIPESTMHLEIAALLSCSNLSGTRLSFLGARHRELQAHLSNRLH